MNCHPNVLFVGPMRAGTSWIHSYLSFRGDVVLPTGVKETFYFDKRFGKNIDWYISHFESKGIDNRVIEVAPSYFHSEQAPKRIIDAIGRVKIVITLRDPLERAWSHYLHLYRKGYTSKMIIEAVNQYPEILTASMYSKNIEKWLQFFSGNVTILRQEDLSNSPQDFADRVADILGLNSVTIPSHMYLKNNSITVPPSYFVAKSATLIGNILREKTLWFY